MTSDGKTLNLEVLSLGIDHGGYSPHVQKQIVYAGVQNSSFAAGRDDLLNLARLKISEKQVERVTERIGQERVDQREKQVQAFLALPMMEKFATPAAHPPDLAVVSMDGGRLQIRDWPSSDAALGGVASPVAATEPPSITAAAGVASPAAAVEAPVEAGPAGPAPGAEPAVEAGPAGPAPGAEPAVEAGPAESEPSPSQVRSGHWREDKIGLLMTMTSEESAVDPGPTITETFVNPLRILKLARELKKGCTPGADAVADPAETEGENPLEGPEYTPPAVRVRSMVATRHENESRGKSGVLQPIMPLDSPVKVRPWELTVYPRSHIRR